MRNSLHVLAKQFFDKASVDECSLEEFRHVAKRHPYFAPVQFLLVHKLKEATKEMEKQKAKAVLFYPDPLVFEAFIAEDHFSNDKPSIVEDGQKTIQVDTVSIDNINTPESIIEIPAKTVHQADKVDTNYNLI